MKDPHLKSPARRFRSLGILAGLGLVSHVSAALIVYEGFEYAAGTDLSTQTGGSGWNTAWGTTVGDTVVSGSLGYVDGLGNTLVTTGNSARISGEDGTSLAFRDTPQFGTDGTTIWISFVAERSGDAIADPNNPYPRGGSLVSLHQAGGERLNIGNASNTAENFWALNPTGGTTGFFSDVPYGGGGPALAVVRIDFLAGNDAAYLFMNPTLGVEPAIGLADVTLSGDFAFNRVRTFAGNAGGTFNGIDRPFAVVTGDEIRIGDSYADVTPFIPVPEPSSVGLSVIGLAALMRRRKRRV